MPPAIKRALINIGLADKEVAVLLVLLQNGPMLATNVSKIAKLNRTTTYGLLKELSGKGLVSSVNKNESATRYQSIAPEMLPGYVERKRDELLSSKKDLEGVIPQLLLMRNKGKVLPKVQFFEGISGVEQAYEDMLEHNNEKMIYALTGLEGAVTSMTQTWMDYFIDQRNKRSIKAEYIVPATQKAIEATKDDAKKGRVASFIPAEYNFNTEICIYDHKVSILSYSQENPVALIIEDETIAYAMKQIFNYVQSTAK
ncbi:MAG: transcriptional regulator TrmB [Candidatus Kaiserbacteria bacterium]|nr:transcriptional regulator TrmB [Candidatus Kaiserbacteria bacterium]